MSAPELFRARREVAWFFGSATGALGLRGIGFDGGGNVVWDDARAERLHLSKLSVAHRSIVERFERVQATLARIGRDRVGDLRLVYEPFGSSRASWQAQSAFSVEGRQLFALALRTPELSVACIERRKGDAALSSAAPTLGELLAFVEDEIARTTIRPGRALPYGHRLEPVLRAAVRRELDAMTAYDVLRAEREREREREREELLASLSRELHTKLWG